MITEAMVTKALTCIGAYAVTKKVAVPVAGWVGTKVGRGLGKLVAGPDRKERKTSKGKVETDQMKEQAILDLMAECDEAFADENNTDNPGNAIAIVKEIKPEPMFDQRMQDWIQRIQLQYGGFENI